MASMGFSYAQIHVQQERCRMRNLKAQEKEKKSNEDLGEGEEDNNRRPNKVEDKAGGGGGSWASGRVHPCARTAAPEPHNSGW
ncbi:unnamed protein product [Miscanthus lutarioriparius]|uniref:Uncharacterized protein n=1 Tax=Miscanthus lutarioriparius TaxID=422564 RepID=A0A811MWS9_9POAL|nr:unnamed protein product [Miscanthus lutarioriparius]